MDNPSQQTESSVPTNAQNLPLFTCIACQIAFYSADQQRTHYRSDWHRYNLKRKVAELPPVTAENFAQRLLAQQAKAAEDSKRAEFSAECSVCKKAYSSENAFNNHLNSKKHKENEARMLQAMDVESTKHDAESERRKQEREIKKQLTSATTEEEVAKLIEKKKATALRLNPDADCLFCTHKSESFEANLDHMTKEHSLFIPDLEYLVDLRGLIKYLADKISVANVCLYCNGRGRVLHSLEAVRKHMLDKGHTKIAYDTEIDILEISDFYDFSSTYPDAAEHNGSEDVDMFDGVSGRSKLMNQHLEEEDGELVLPNGNRVGHRSLQRYYKQSIPLERPEKDSVVIHKMLTSYEENPEYSTQLSQASRNRAMILAQPNGYKAWKATATFKEKRVRDQFKTNIGIRNNGLQRHYREQNPI
ncbi:C2H2 type zinc-finger-domain-containing protein [Coemansia mojavensis]|nr:C2H2 type zinc-finger-domain-containing protein [Coemansia mojavensis]